MIPAGNHRPREKMNYQDVGGGPFATVHLWLLVVARALLRPLRYRGLGRTIAVIGRIFPKGHFVDALIAPSWVLRVDLGDAYWMAPLLRGSGYENELEVVLKRFLDERTAFIDCGANIGYWSVVAASLGRARKIVAIEAASHLVTRLQLNSELNRQSFEVVHAAIWSEPSKTLTLATERDRHSWGSVAPQVVSDLVEAGFHETEVVTTTLDEISSKEDAPRFIVKLDVEGAEIEALKGAGGLFTKEVLFVIEQHSRDPSLVVSRTLLGKGFRLFTVGEGENPVEFRDAAALAQIPRQGEAWNVIACAAESSFAAHMDAWMQG